MNVHCLHSNWIFFQDILFDLKTLFLKLTSNILEDMRPGRSTPTLGMFASPSTPTPTWTFTTWTTSISTKVRRGLTLDSVPLNMMIAVKYFRLKHYEEYRVNVSVISIILS